MRFSRVLVHRLSRLSAPVAIRAVEIQRADAMFANDAFERDSAVHRLGCVVSHITILVANRLTLSGH